MENIGKAGLGRVLVVEFWATWCPPCRHEIPLLKKLRADRRKQNLEVVGIAVDFREDVLALVVEWHVNSKCFPVAVHAMLGLEDAVEGLGLGLMELN